MTDLGRFGTGPFRCYINNRGVVVRRLGAPTGKTRFIMWTREAGARELDFVAANSAEPRALNDNNQFLVWAKPSDIRLFGRLLHRRQECYLWDENAGVTTLHDGVSIPDLVFLKVVDINNQGCITAIVRTANVEQLRAVVLEPIAEERTESKDG
jgi:hypothetical protein